MTCGTSCPESLPATATTTATTALLPTTTRSFSASNGNGNANQQTWGAGNNINNQWNSFSPVIGGIGLNVGATAAIGGSSIAADAPIAVGNGNNIGAAAALNTAGALGTNLGGALGAALGGSNLGAQIPIAAPINLGAAVPIDIQAQIGCATLALDCNNVGGSPNAQGASQTNGLLNDVDQLQTAGNGTANATNTQTATATAAASNNTTTTTQIGGDTIVTASAESGSAGNAIATTVTTATAAGNLSDNFSLVNLLSNSGNRSTNSVGGHNNSSNTNTAGDNSTVFGLAAAAAVDADPDVWEILSGILNGNGNNNGRNRFLADNNTLIGVLNGNGNASQQTWGSGNTINNQYNSFSPVIGGVAVNGAVTAAIGGSSLAVDAPVAVANGNNVGATLGLNTALDLSTNVGAALGAALGGSNIGAQAPVTAPVNVGLAVPVNLQLQAICVAGLGCDNEGRSSSSRWVIATKSWAGKPNDSDPGCWRRHRHDCDQCAGGHQHGDCHQQHGGNQPDWRHNHR